MFIAEPDIVWADLPTPDVVVVQSPGGAVTVVADLKVPAAVVLMIIATRDLATMGMGTLMDLM